MKKKLFLLSSAVLLCFSCFLAWDVLTKTGTGGDIVDLDTSTFDIQVTEAGTWQEAGHLTIIGLTHSYGVDLTATLISPAGTRRTIFSQPSGSFSGGEYEFSYSESGEMTYVSPGTYSPSEALSFYNESITGTWTLEFVDDTGIGSGTFDSWELGFEYQTP
jgi:subtilisin-like proprotein convertase family protein